MVVENIGDVDLDGYSDLAISAPFEGSGVVYIFRGSSSRLVPDDYQVGCSPFRVSVTSFPGGGGGGGGGGGLAARLIHY